MKKKFQGLMFGLVLLGLTSCGNEATSNVNDVPEEVVIQLKEMGFNPDGIVKTEGGYLIERDILITEEFLKENTHKHVHHIPALEQYRTNQLVTTNGSREITVYISAADNTTSGTVINKAKGGKGKPGGGGSTTAEFSTKYGAALNEALARFNNENLEITFKRVYSASGADIVFKRLNKRDERRGVLGSAGFPSNGNPYNTVNMSGTINWDVNGIATVMAHELGHCIGFRHTDFYDRSISCGGTPTNEGDGGVGAVHIPGTPTGRSNESWMLSCTGGGDRPFNNDDKTALDYLY